MSRRLTLKEAALPEGAALVQMCRQIIADGKIDLGEIKELRSFLQDHKDASSVPAIPYLHELMTRITADKKVDRKELKELQIAIQAVLPDVSNTSSRKHSQAHQESLAAVSNRETQECYDCGEIITDSRLKRGRDGNYYCSPCFSHLRSREAQEKHVSDGRRSQSTVMKTEPLERPVQTKQSSATKAPVRKANKQVFKCDGCGEMKPHKNYTVPTPEGRILCIACGVPSRSAWKKISGHPAAVLLSFIVLFVGILIFCRAIL